MNEYYLFLDESKPIGSITYFCLAGCIISKEEYTNEIIPKINTHKRNIFGRTDIIFHESEIRETKGDFAILVNTNTRKAFWDGIHNIFKNSNMQIVGTCVSKKISKKYYNTKSINPDYYIALQIVLENFVYFLEQHTASGSIAIESSTLSKRLTNLYHTIVSNGTLFLSKNVFQEHLTTINFYIKQDNHIGLQLADFIPNSLNRRISGLKRKPYSLLEIIDSKLYDGAVFAKERFGLKIIE